MNIIQEQLKQLIELHPASVITPLPDTSTLLAVPNVRIPPGWSKAESTIAFVIPAGFPTARPDCFWSDPALLLANGGPPANSNPQVPPGGAALMRWFSWHLQTWNPNRDTVYTYLDFCLGRLRDCR
jgi:E2/UBC family protein E